MPLPARIRLSHTDVSVANLQAPGVTWGLLRKVATERFQISRGKACARCRSKKLKCDSGAPCMNCVKSRVQCSSDAPHGNDTQISSANDLKYHVVIEQPVKTTIWGINSNSRVLSSDLEQLYAPQNNPLNSIFAMYGIPTALLFRMLSNVPPKLHLALSHLGARMRTELPSAPHLDLLPTTADVWEGSTLCRQIIRLQNSSKLCAHNEAISQLAGAHPEEIAARINLSELPAFTSEYRLLCLHLYLLLARLRGAQQLTHFQPMFASFCRQPRPGSRPAVQMYRVTRNLYQDGEINVLCAVQPEEYDAAVRVCPEARMEFVECDLAGRELSGERLAETEQIQRMAATAEGRAKLERLADSVIDKFKLEIPQQPMPTSQQPMVTSQQLMVTSQQHTVTKRHTVLTPKPLTIT